MNAVTAEDPAVARAGDLADGDPGASRRQGRRARVRRGAEERAGGAVLGGRGSWRPRQRGEGRLAWGSARCTLSLLPSWAADGGSGCRAYQVHVSRIAAPSLTRVCVVADRFQVHWARMSRLPPALERYKPIQHPGMSLCVGERKGIVTKITQGK